jgi:hypothetical protein
MSQYQQASSTGYARGITSVGATTLSIGQFSGKSKAALSGLQSRLFHCGYQFGASLGGSAGTGNYAGGGGGGGVSISLNGVAVTPNVGASNAAGTGGGAAGAGFGAGGGGCGSVKARYILLQYGNSNGGAGRCLNLGGIYVYSQYGGANIITSGMTVTSLDLYDGNSFPNSNLVDGNEGTFAHSSCGSEYPWLKVDLGSEQMIYKVTVVNRQGCCGDRICGLQVLLQDASSNTVYTSGMMEGYNGSTAYQGNGSSSNSYLYYSYWPSVNTTDYGSNADPYPSQLIPYGGGQGASGFAYIQLGGTEYFTNVSTTYTFTSAGTAKILLMGGGGGGGIYAGANSRGGGGGGAGYLQAFFVSVSNNTTATITIGAGGTPGVNGGNTSAVINGATYAVGGGQHGDANQYGGTGSTSGGSGGSGSGASAGPNSGNTQANTSSQGIVAHGAFVKNEGGYFADDPAWFWNRSESYTPNLTTDLSSAYAITGGNAPSANNTWSYYSIELFGYFYAPTSGSYTFYTASDDASFLWIGATALSGYTTANALVKNGGIHGVTEISASITLTANTYYPIRVQMGQREGGDGFTISFAGPGISKTSNWAGYAWWGLGTDSNLPVESARLLKASYSANNVDRPYYVNVNGTSTSTYCLMDSKWNGGGWMMLMKATRGSTFEYGSTYWTDAGTTLNTGNVNRADGDAKYAVMNSAYIKDVLALWPDVGYTGGSISQTDSWSWLVNYYFYGGARVTGVTGFGSNSRNATDSTLNQSNPNSYSGFSSNIWSTQVGAYRHVIGGGAHLGASTNVRWGFLWNNEADFYTIDVAGGIGMGFGPYSAGDLAPSWNVTNGGSTALSRNMRVELYGR